MESILDLRNLYCAFCGEQKFKWDGYGLRCKNCNGGIMYDVNKEEFRYTYPSLSNRTLDPNTGPKGLRWQKLETGWYNCLPQYDIYTGHKLPDYEQIKKLENEVAGHESAIRKLMSRIKQLGGDKQ